MNVCMCSFLCICIYLHSPFLGVCASVCMHVCESVCLPQLFSTFFFFEIESLIKPGIFQFVEPVWPVISLSSFPQDWD